jgi:hypothetical protein
MTNQELIIKYKRQIERFEKLIDLSNGDSPRLISKCSILKMVIIDLQE